MNRAYRWFFTFIIPCALPLVLMRCTPQTKTSTLPVTIPDSFSVDGTNAIPEQWWTTFQDSTLNVIMDTALSSNFNLQTSWYRLKQAEAVVDRASASLLPDVEATMRGSIDRPRPDFVGGESVRTGISATYEIDLWGRIRSSVDAAQYRADAAYTDYQTAAISLSAEITRTWYQLIEAQNQLDIINNQIVTNENILSLLTSRLGTGQVLGVDVLRQEQLLESTKEQKTYALAQYRVISNRLSVLTGKPPGEQSFNLPDSLPQLPPLPATGVPSSLIERRPDIKQAWHQLQAADRDLATSISSKYPRFTLNTSASLRSNNVNNLFENWAYSIGGNLLAPLFYGGELRAEVDRNEAIKQQNLLQYGQTILMALREVEDAIVREQQQAASVQTIERQLDLARRAYERLQMAYFNGTSNYLDVLTALDEVQQLRRNKLSANLTLLDNRISLYRALAGGFETNIESEKQVLDNQP